MKRIFAAFLCLCLLLCGCQTDGETAGEPAADITPEELFSDRDLSGKYDENTVYISLSGQSAACNGNGVSIQGSTVTVTKGGTYVLTGTLSDGMIIINADKTEKVQLAFEGAAIHSETCAPIYVQQADKVFITLAEGTENSLSNGGVFTPIDESNIDAVIFSREDLTLNGTGTLTVTSPAGHGIVSKDELTVASGKYIITSASHGLCGKDSVAIADGSFVITSGKDGIHGENDQEDTPAFVYIGGGSFRIDAADDAIRANGNVDVAGGVFQIAAGDDGFHADETLTVTGGQITITESYEGLEGLHVLVSGGTIDLRASDDGINAAGGMDQSGMDDFRGGGWGGPGRPGGGMGGQPGGMSAGNGSITITGGHITIYAAGDGLDANGTLAMSGGYMQVCGPTVGDTATLDYDTSATITGGTFVGTGASNMAQTFSDSNQGVLAVSIRGTIPAGTQITVADVSGNVMLSYTPEASFAVIIFSSPQMVKGQTYQITAGTVSGSVAAQ